MSSDLLKGLKEEKRMARETIHSKEASRNVTHLIVLKLVEY